MADARHARLIDAQLLGPETRLLTFQLEQPLGFIGGQYIIVNTGLPLPGGKVAKRAYSILSPDSDQLRFQIAVKRVGSGPGSNFMHNLSVGSELVFSGPWGKFYLEENDVAGPTLVFASDTGITAALGLLRGRRMQSIVANARSLWFVDSLDYFVPTSNLPDRVAALPTGLPVHHPDRPAQACALLRKLCGESKPERAFLSGDGAILFPLCEELKALGVPESAIRMECFFNNPFRKAP